MRPRLEFEGSGHVHRLVIHRDIFHHYAGRNRIESRARGIDHRRALQRGEPQRTSGGLPCGRVSGSAAFTDLETIGGPKAGHVKLGEMPVKVVTQLLAADAKDSLVRTQPKTSLLVLEYLEDHVRQARRFDPLHLAVTQPAEAAAIASCP